MYVWQKSLIVFFVILFFTLSTYAERVVVTNPQTNKGEQYVVIIRSMISTNNLINFRSA